MGDANGEEWEERYRVWRVLGLRVNPSRAEMYGFSVPVCSSL